LAHTGSPHRGSLTAADASFTEAIDRRTGCIRASGRLDTRAADMVSGTIEALHDQGWARIVLDLGGVQDADAAGLRTIQSLERRISAGGGHVALLNCPEPRTD
jgi:anti-anti-sigma factor